MPRKIELAMFSLAVAGLVVAFSAWRWPAEPRPKDITALLSARTSQAPSPAIYPKASLLVSGSAAHVVIRVGLDGAWYEGGEVSSAGSNSTIYIPLGQRLSISLTGAASLIEIEAPLMPYVQVQNVGAAARVVEI